MTQIIDGLLITKEYLEKTTKKLEAETKEHKQLLIVGFFVLLFMLATIVVMELIQYQNSYESLITKIYELDKGRYVSSFR